MLESLPTVLGEVAKPEGVLRAIYSDLASPGVQQVGKALETVLRTGNILLLPLRMLNEYAANFEKKNFEQIAARFSEIPEADIVDVRPEIGVPILEKLSATHDPDLRKLFIELLASAADKGRVETAHPSFVRVIENLSPDEAQILKGWSGSALIPCLTVVKMSEGGGSVTVRDLVVIPPEPLTPGPRISVYISNMAGLGLVLHHADRWLSQEGAYDPLIEFNQRDFPEIKDGSLSLKLLQKEKFAEGDIVYNKGCIEITSYGRVFQKACIA